LGSNERSTEVAGGGEAAAEKAGRLLDAYRAHLQTTEPHINKRHQLLRDAV